MRVSGPLVAHCSAVRRPLWWCWGLMGHSVDDVVQPHAKSHRREGFRVVRIVGPFPRVAEMHVVADGHDDSAFVISYGAPLGLITILFIRAPRPYVLLSRYLHFVIDIVEGVEDFIAALKVLDRPVGKDLTHAVHKAFPVFGAVEVVDH